MLNTRQIEIYDIEFSDNDSTDSLVFEFVNSQPAFISIAQVADTRVATVNFDLSYPASQVNGLWTIETKVTDYKSGTAFASALMTFYVNIFGTNS